MSNKDALRAEARGEAMAAAASTRLAAEKFDKAKRPIDAARSRELARLCDMRAAEASR